MSIKEKVAFITGGAQGLGAGIAETYFANGAKVVVADMNMEHATATAKKLDPSLARTLAVAVDVTSESAVNDAFDQTIAKFGKVDILVSNAGIQIVERIENYSFANWKKMLAVHLDGAFLTTKRALQDMYSRKEGGSIIYMGSVHSKLASPLKSAYVTAKHGLLGLARTVAKEGAAHGVRANVICPGFVMTELVKKQIPEQAKELGIGEEEVIKKIMLGETVDGEFTTMEDIARVALFFADFENNALTGQSLIASHGWGME